MVEVSFVTVTLLLLESTSELRVPLVVALLAGLSRILVVLVPEPVLMSLVSEVPPRFISRFVSLSLSWAHPTANRPASRVSAIVFFIMFPLVRFSLHNFHNLIASQRAVPGKSPQ